MREQTDAIVVGARCAGSATAIALARAGRRVLVLDRARFPADTLSTHLLFAGGVAELSALGVLERVERLGAPRLPLAMMSGAGVEVWADQTPIGGIDYSLCVRRTGLDAALVGAARDAGAEIHEGIRVTGLIRDGAGVAGVVATDRDGRESELRAEVVIGADGRRSTVAGLLGKDRPYRANPNGRACCFGYWRDRGDRWRSVAAQWRAGEELGAAFPCDGGLVLVLLMPPVSRAEEFRRDPTGTYLRSIEAMPGLRERLAGCELEGKARFTTDTGSYFRRSTGDGWALAGDAGHFKDPVTAQGIRDALRFGRLLGEAVAPVLGDPRATRRALRGWERRRDRECLETYQWTNQLGRAERMTPLEIELYRAAAADPELARRFLDVFSRARRPGEVLNGSLALRLAWRAVAHSGGDRLEAIRSAARQLGSDAGGRMVRALAVARF